MAFAQSKKELEREREKLLREISVTSKVLKKTTKNKTAALNRYVTLQKQIKKRKRLVRTIQKEIAYTNGSIERSSTVIEALHDDINRLKAEYTELAQKAYRQKLSNTTLVFVFSANNFNEAFRRWQYIKQYDNYRKKQAVLIQETQARLSTKVATLEKRRLKKEKLLREQQKQANLLSNEMKESDSMYKNLQKDEKRLKTELNEYRVAHKKLTNAIESVILAESSKKIRSSRNKSSSSSTPTATNDNNKENNTSTTISQEKEISDLAVISKTFKTKKGKLPWPVKSGIITRYFGTQAHPTLKKIQITNNGIDIQTNEATEARAIFEGEVAGIQFIPGYNNTLIVKHGDFFTVYSNLEEVYVEQGDYIKQRQEIGRISTNAQTNATEIHFEIWQNKKRLNPLDWISKR